MAGSVGFDVFRKREALVAGLDNEFPAGPQVFAGAVEPLETLGAELHLNLCRPDFRLRRRREPMEKLAVLVPPPSVPSPYATTVCWCPMAGIATASCRRSRLRIGAVVGWGGRPCSLGCFSAEVSPCAACGSRLRIPRRPDRSGLDRTQSGGSRAAGGAPAVDPATPPVRVGGLTGLVDRLRLRPGGLARPQRPSGSGLILTRGDRNQNGTPRTAEGPANDFKGGCRPLTALSALAEGPHRCHILPIFHPVRETIKGVKMQERL